MQKNILLYPPKHKIAEYLWQTKICIFTPYINTEGFPIALLDAMACGVITVTFPFYGIEEVIRHNKNGFIENNLENMSQRIIKILKNYQSFTRISKLAKNQVLHYNADNNIIYYIRLLNV